MVGTVVGVISSRLYRYGALELGWVFLDFGLEMLGKANLRV